MKPNFLATLTPDSITNGPFPLNEILENSVFYPASSFDGGVIRDCNVNRRDWEVVSFVYCDYYESKERLDLTDMPRGYRVLGERSVTERELTPNGWVQQLPPNLNLKHYRWVVEQFANKTPFVTWKVFERLPEFGESHGPQRFSLLFLCADGVAAYQALYWSNHTKPRAVAIIQPGTGFGFNWTDFFKKKDPFYWVVSNNPAGMPEFVYCGYWSDSATEAQLTAKSFHFDWPEYQPDQPAVGYPQHQVLLYKKTE